MEEMSKGQILNYNNCTGQEQKIKIKKKVSWNLPQTDTESDEEFSDEKRNCSPQKKKASNRNTQKKKPLNRNTQKKISLKKNALKIDDNTKKKGKRKGTNTKAPSEKDITNVKTVNCNAVNLLSKAVQKIKPHLKNKKTKKTVSEKVKTDKKVNAKSASKVKKKELITDKEANAKQNSKSKPRKEKKELKVTVCSKPEMVLKKEIINTDELDEGPSNNDKIVAIEDVADILRDADYMKKSESCSGNDDKIIISKDAVTEMDGVCDQEVSIMSDSDSSSDFEDVEPLNVSPDTELKPSSSDTFDQSETSPDSAKKTEDKDKEVNMRQNKKGKNKKEKQELTKNEKAKEVSSKSTKRKKSNKKPEDSGPPVKKKKTDSKTNLGKRKTKSDTSERCKKAKLKKESNDEDVEEPIKTKKIKSEKDEKLKQRTTSRTKKKKKEGAGKSFSSKKGNVTFDDTDVTAVLLKMEGASMRQSTSTEEEHEGEDNSESEQSEISGSEDEDWEEVADHHTSMRSQIPDQPIEITLPDTALRKRKKKKAFDWIAYVRRQLIRFQRDVQRDMHKVHLMCLMSWGMKQNSILNSEQISAQVLSLIPESIVPDQDTCGIGQLEAILQWFRDLIELDTEKVENETMTLVKTEDIENALEERKVNSKRLMVAVFVIVLRMMSFNTRLIFSFHPVPLRLAPDNKSKDGQKKNVDDQEEEESPTKKEKKCSKTKLKTNTDKKKSSGKKNNSKKSAKDETSKKGCKYFKKDAKVKKSSSSAIKSTSTSSDSTDVDAETNSSEKERKTFSSKLSKKVRQSTSENSDNDSSEKRRTLRPKPAGRKTKKSDGRAVNSDESGYEDVSVSDNDSDFCDDEFFTKIRQKKLLKKNVKVKKQKSADSAAESSISDVEENDQETKHSVKISKDKDKSVDDKNKFCDSWIEVYLPKEKRWLCVDCERNIVDKPDEIEKNISQPVHYVFAFSTDSSVKDVTSRYASDWMTHTRKLRADSDWLNKMLKPYRSSNVELDDQDDENMRNELIRKPLPKTVGEYKNHPLYVLKRHLLKFEALYPNSAVPVGYIRGEPVYARECVHTLHSRENWLKEGRSVKLGEEAYKMVKSRKYKVPKLDPDALDLELYGFWQTEIYVPPPVVDGKIPRNAYGNLELFQEWMLPTGTVQVKLPGLNRIARKLGVDCVPAMVGWDTHSGYSHPLMDGWIVCSEHEEALQAAWIEDQEIQLLKEVEKKHKRALANWRLLTRSLIIGDRLKKQFDLEQNPECEENTEEVKNGKKADDVQSSWPRNLEKKTQNTPKASKKKPRLCSVETI